RKGDANERLGRAHARALVQAGAQGGAGALRARVPPAHARASRRQRLAGRARHRPRSLVPLLAPAAERPEVARARAGASPESSSETVEALAHRSGVGRVRREAQVAAVGAGRLRAVAHALLGEAEAAPR